MCVCVREREAKRRREGGREGKDPCKINTVILAFLHGISNSITFVFNINFDISSVISYQQQYYHINYYQLKETPMRDSKGRPSTDSFMHASFLLLFHSNLFPLPHFAFLFLIIQSKAPSLLFLILSCPLLFSPLISYPYFHYLQNCITLHYYLRYSSLHHHLYIPQLLHFSPFLSFPRLFFFPIPAS